MVCFDIMFYYINCTCTEVAEFGHQDQISGFFSFKAKPTDISEYGPPSLLIVPDLIPPLSSNGSIRPLINTKSSGVPPNKTFNKENMRYVNSYERGSLHTKYTQTYMDYRYCHRCVLHGKLIDIFPKASKEGTPNHISNQEVKDEMRLGNLNYTTMPIKKSKFATASAKTVSSTDSSKIPNKVVSPNKLKNMYAESSGSSYTEIFNAIFLTLQNAQKNLGKI